MPLCTTSVCMCVCACCVCVLCAHYPTSSSSSASSIILVLQHLSRRSAAALQLLHLVDELARRYSLSLYSLPLFLCLTLAAMLCVIYVACIAHFLGSFVDQWQQPQQPINLALVPPLPCLFAAITHLYYVYAGKFSVWLCRPCVTLSLLATNCCALMNFDFGLKFLPFLLGCAFCTPLLYTPLIVMSFR